MARGRPAGSKSTTAVKLQDLMDHMVSGATVMVGTTWLRDFEKFNNVKFSSEQETPKPITVMDNPEILEPGEEKDAEIRDRINLQSEEL